MDIPAQGHFLRMDIPAQEHFLCTIVQAQKHFLCMSGPAQEHVLCMDRVCPCPVHAQDMFAIPPLPISISFRRVMGQE